MPVTLRVPLTFSLLSLLGCTSHELSFAGRVVDEHGLAMQASELSLRDVGFENDSLVDQDSLGRAEVIERGATDDDGRFTLTHSIPDGGFFCGGLGSVPALVVAPEGSEGPAVVVVGKDTGSDYRAEVGELKIPRDIEVHADETGLYVAAETAPGMNRYLHVDGQLWRLGDDGALPAEALAPCPSEQACEHRIATIWSSGDTRARARRVSLSARAPKPVGTSASSLAAVRATDIYVDGVYRSEAIFSVDEGAPTFDELGEPNQLFEVSLEGPGARSGYARLPASSCSRYGSGVHCVLPTETAIRGLRFAPEGRTDLVARYYLR